MITQAHAATVQLPMDLDLEPVTRQAVTDDFGTLEIFTTADFGTVVDEE